jgi:hypothetical protein
MKTIRIENLILIRQLKDWKLGMFEKLGFVCLSVPAATRQQGEKLEQGNLRLINWQGELKINRENEDQQLRINQ